VREAAALVVALTYTPQRGRVCAWGPERSAEAACHSCRRGAGFGIWRLVESNQSVGG